MIAFARATEERDLRIASVSDLYGRSAERRTAYAINLEATVWYSNVATGRVILHDASGTADVQMDLDGRSVHPGDRVRILGRGTLLNLGNGFELTRLAAVDNDGLHAEEERAGSVWLEAGRHPVRLEWFNAGGDAVLGVDYEGPGFSRQRMPDSVFWRADRSSSADETHWHSGLDFRTFHERWWMIPPAVEPSLTALAGTAGNFDIAVASREENVAIDFGGFLQIDEPGEYTFFLRSDDGSRLFIGASSLGLSLAAGGGVLPEPDSVLPGQFFQGEERYRWARMEGRVVGTSEYEDVKQVEVESGAGRARVEVADWTDLSAAAIVGQRVRCTGVARRDLSPDGIPVATSWFVQGGRKVEILEIGTARSREEAEAFATDMSGILALPAPPEVAPIERIYRLERDSLNLRHPVRIKGVVTNSLSDRPAVVIQDATRGIYVNLAGLRPVPIQLGDLLQVDGMVDAGEFSPFVHARRLERLGTGTMPVPVEATRDQMINGSLHCQYVEIEGYVLDLDRGSVTLRTRAGVMKIDVDSAPSERLLNAVVRMRGCLGSRWDAQSRQIRVDTVVLADAAISIARAAPADPFDAPRKGATELLKFDPESGAFQRVRLTGQVMHAIGTKLYLMDEGRGVRVSLASVTSLSRGDLVEISGFPEFDGPSPHFVQAAARKVGHEGLPSARPLPPDNLLQDGFDSTLVSVEADLIGIGFQEGRNTMQLRAGLNTFSARIEASPNETAGYEPGSRMRLTGVYLGLGGNRTLGRPVEAFEMVLASANDIEVLATPPWWTLPRLLALVGILGVVLLGSFVWITQLRRQVAVRSEQLRLVIEERHRLEQREELERERSRLAHDLHDELGAGLSEVGLLGALARTSTLPPAKREGHLTRLTDTARRLVMSLDEIVWAVNPRYDSVASFVGYYTAYAQQFLELASVRCRFDVAVELPEEALTSRVRHGLFLAFKETLTNVVKHARASEVVIRIFVERQRLVMAVSDNGCGLKTSEWVPGMDGLASLKHRLRDLGGQCEVESDERGGTTVSLKLPLP